MRKLNIFLICVLFCSSYILLLRGFVIEKEPIKAAKIPSKTVLKEQCCENFVQIIEKAALLTASLSVLQQKTIAVVRDFFCNVGTGIFSSAKKAELAALVRKTDQLLVDLIKLTNEVEAFSVGLGK